MAFSRAHGFSPSPRSPSASLLHVSLFQSPLPLYPCPVIPPPFPPGPWDGVTGEHTALESPSNPPASLSSAIAVWKRLGMPLSKMVLGLATYGYVYTLADATNNAVGAPISDTRVRASLLHGVNNTRWSLLKYKRQLGHVVAEEASTCDEYYRESKPLPLEFVPLESAVHPAQGSHCPPTCCKSSPLAYSAT